MAIITCTGCGRQRPHAARRLCIACYQRRRREGRPQEVRHTITCAACGEDHPHAAHGWCTPCYQRWVRHGRPTDGPPPPRQPQPCGTDAGYQRHVKYGEPIDDACRAARNAAQNQRRAKAKSKSTIRDRWTDEQTRAARTVAIAAEGSPADRRLLLEVLGLVAAPDTAAIGQRAA
jgi:hypothetical protein